MYISHCFHDEEEEEEEEEEKDLEREKDSCFVFGQILTNFGQ